GGGEMTHERTRLPGLGDGQREGKADEKQSRRPRAEGGRADHGEHAEDSEGNRHDPMNEAEPHSAASVPPASAAGLLSTSAKKRSTGSAPAARSARTTSPALVRIVTKSPRFKCAIAREAISRIRRSKPISQSSCSRDPRGCGSRVSRLRVVSGRASRAR